MKLFQVLGIISMALAFLFIGVCILVSPWFNVYNNALSDLGNMDLHSSTSWIFNMGLIVSGFLVALSSILLSIRKITWKYHIWTIPLTLAGVDLALIGFFPENIGGTHFIVSVIFFVSLILTMLLHSYSSLRQGTLVISAISLILAIASIIIWSCKWPWRGVAIQETATSAITAFWLIWVYQKNKLC